MIHFVVKTKIQESDAIAVFGAVNTRHGKARKTENGSSRPCCRRRVDDPGILDFRQTCDFGNSSGLRVDSHFHDGVFGPNNAVPHPHIHESRQHCRRLVIGNLRSVAGEVMPRGVARVDSNSDIHERNQHRNVRHCRFCSFEKGAHDNSEQENEIDNGIEDKKRIAVIPGVVERKEWP